MEEAEALAAAVVDFFQSLFTQEMVDGVADFLALIPNLVSSDDNESFLRLPQLDEIKQAV